MPTWWCLHELDVCTGLPKKASGNHESHALTPLYCSINTNPFFIFNSLKSHQSCNSRANSSLKNCKRLIAYSNSHNDARYNLSFCSADTKFQYIIIIWEMIWPCEALMLHFDDKCRHTHLWSAPATSMHHFGRKKADLENPILKQRNSALKLAFISKILPNISLFWTFSFKPSIFLMLVKSFLLGHYRLIRLS